MEFNHPEYQNVVHFCQNRHYQFGALPFGLAIDFWMHTKTLVPVLAALRMRRLLIGVVSGDLLLSYSEPGVQPVHNHSVEVLVDFESQEAFAGCVPEIPCPDLGQSVPTV